MKWVSNENLQYFSNKIKEKINNKYEKPTEGIPYKDLESSIQQSLQRADSALQSAPVTSVAGRTGNVTLSKSDVGLDNVNNTADSQKSVLYAESAGKAVLDNMGNNIPATYATKNEVSTAQTTADEAKSIAQGRAKAVAFDTITDMTSALKNATANEYKVGDNLFIRAIDVPDYWISNVLTNNSGVYGFYEISELETQKVDLSTYQQKIDNTLQTDSKTVIGAINELNTDTIVLQTDVATAQKTAENSAIIASQKYTKPSGGIPVDDLSESVKASLQKAETALQSAPVTSVAGKTGSVVLSKSDVGLGNVDNTADAVKSVSHAETAEKAEKDQIDNIIHVTYATKTSVSTAQQTADEAKSIAQGRNRSVAFDNLEAMKTALKAMDADALKIGDNVYIRAVDVPDYWVSAVLSTNSGETGYFELSPLETSKIDLADYQTKNDNSLQTGSKNVVGAINELNSTVSTIETEVSTIQTTAESAQEIASAAQTTAESKYEKPSGGIPETDLAANVQNKLNPNYKSELIDIVYPVGSIYMSVNDVSPAFFLGGEWVSIQNRFLFAASSEYAAGTTGGEEQHILTISELPEHQHTSTPLGYYAYGGFEATSIFAKDVGAGYRTNLGNVLTGKAGGNVAHNNMPPYLAVYMWKRVQ